MPIIEMFHGIVNGMSKCFTILESIQFKTRIIDCNCTVVNCCPAWKVCLPYLMQPQEHVSQNLTSRLCLPYLTERGIYLAKPVNDLTNRTFYKIEKSVGRITDNLRCCLKRLVPNYRKNVIFVQKIPF